jgi:hypothetical protein
MKSIGAGSFEETDIAPRHTVESMVALKAEILANLNEMERRSEAVNNLFKGLDDRGSIHRIEYDYRGYGEGILEKSVDQRFWRYLVQLFSLEKYMLCTDYQKLKKEIEEYHFPRFDAESAQGWLAGLKGLIHDNVTTLVHSVFDAITQGTYYVGGYSGSQKKRNNNGVDTRFILHTADYRVLSYWSTDPTVTDDLEKVAYILDGKTLPEETLKSRMRTEKTLEAGNDYFRIKVCANGNTHYTLTDSLRDKLNKYGPSGAIIGEDIKIKIIERWRS